MKASSKWSDALDKSNVFIYDRVISCIVKRSKSGLIVVILVAILLIEMFDYFLYVHNWQYLLVCSYNCMHLMWNLSTFLYLLSGQLYLSLHLFVFIVYLTESLSSYHHFLHELFLQFLVYFFLIQSYLSQLFTAKLLLLYIHHRTKFYFFQQNLSNFEAIFGVNSFHWIISSKKSILFHEVPMVFLHVLIERTITKVLAGADAFIAHRFMVSVSHTIALSHSLLFS